MATSKVAYLVKPKIVNGVEGEAIVELRDIEIPTPGPGEILVKVEGCGICGTDVHEYRYNPFGYKEIVLGHEGTGEVIAVGEGVTVDTKGDPIKVGDKVVTSVLLCGECDYCKRYPELPNLCAGLGVYGLIEDDAEHHNNGWFAEHILVRKNSSIFVVNDKTLDERMLIEPACVCVHSWNRAKSTNIIDFSSTVLVQGCGPIGLMQIAVLKAAGVVNIIAVDGVETRLNLAKEMGATHVINFRELKTIEERVAQVQALTKGFGADFVFQCTGVPQAAADAYKYVRRGGAMCELGFFVDNGDTTYNPHQDICNKEIKVIGSWTYQAKDWMQACDMLKEAQKDGLPVEELLTHKYALADINEAMEMNISMQGLKIVVKGE